MTCKDHLQIALRLLTAPAMTAESCRARTLIQKVNIYLPSNYRDILFISQLGVHN